MKFKVLLNSSTIMLLNLVLFVLQILEVKSPIKQSKSDKQIKNGDCDKVNQKK